jgi:hypothetical protein
MVPLFWLLLKYDVTCASHRCPHAAVVCCGSQLAASMQVIIKGEALLLTSTIGNVVHLTCFLGFAPVCRDSQ